MHYMLLIYGEDPCGPARREVENEPGMLEFAEECRRRGAYVAASPLYPVDTATTVRVREGEVLLTDGPFAETREQLGGYYILDCADLDEALELAARCPRAANGSVEVRPMVDVAARAARAGRSSEPGQAGRAV